MNMVSNYERVPVKCRALRFNLLWDIHNDVPTATLVYSGTSGTYCNTWVRNRMGELELLLQYEYHSIIDASLPARVHKKCKAMIEARIVPTLHLNYYTVEKCFMHFALRGRGSVFPSR